MQVSSIYRRAVVLPLDAKAEESLRCNDIEEDTPIRCLQIQNQSFFDRLWESGLFQAINARSGSLIDDYEQELIESDAIGSILDSIEEVKSKRDAFDSDFSSFLDDLAEISTEAQKLGRPVLFVL